MFAEYWEKALSHETNIKTTIKSERSVKALFRLRGRSAHGEAARGPRLVSAGSAQRAGQGGEEKAGGAVSARPSLSSLGSCRRCGHVT